MRRLGLAVILACCLAARLSAADDDRKLCGGSLDRQISIAACTRWLAGHPRDAEALYWRGIEYAETEKHDLAIADYEKALAIDPAYVDALFSRAFSLAALGRTEAAIADLMAARKLAPQDKRLPGSLRRLGVEP